MTAVKEPYRNRNIGTALKLHQRSWAIEHGYDTITWTFDPLVRRNAKMNLVKLGVDVFDYFSDFYGDLPDDLNAGDPTDRVIAHWNITNPNVLAKNTIAHEIPVALKNRDEKPIQIEVDSQSSQLLCYLPTDIIQLRARDRALALEWRIAMRNQLQTRLNHGWHISGFTSDGAYILAQSHAMTANS
jgi:predicted GNAT superfamily acetyltransferase